MATSYIDLPSATIANGSTTAVVTGVILTDLARAGDFFIQSGLIALIDEIIYVSGSTWEIELTLPWAGPTSSAAPAQIQQIGDTVRLNQSINELISLLSQSGTALVFAAPPSNDIGIDNQIGFVPSLRAYYQKIEGVWVKLDTVAFSANKNATPQTGIATGTPTKVTFGTEAFDTGAGYDPATSRLTPPAGKYHLTARALVDVGAIDQAIFQLEIRKNGTAVHRFTAVGSGEMDLALAVSGVVVSNGTTDYFEVWFTGAGAGDKTIGGAIADTSFEGMQLNMPSGPTVSDVLATLGVGTMTISDSPPTGGNNNDIWFQV